MWKYAIAVLAGSVVIDPATAADDTPKDPVAVWELYSEGTTRVQLLPNGTTEAGEKWEQNLARLMIGNGDYTISPGGRSFGGRRKGGAVVRARLLMKNILLDSEPDQPAPEAPSTTKNGSASTFASHLVGPWELTAWNRKKDKQLYLSLDLTDDNKLLDEKRKIAAWSVDKRNKITFDFVDARFEDAVLSPRNRDTLFGKARSGRDTWTLTLLRIRPIALCNTDSLGQITLYSNGRIDGTNGLKSRSYWTMQGKQLEISDFICTLSADRKSLTGRGSYGAKIKGTFVQAPK